MLATNATYAILSIAWRRVIAACLLDYIIKALAVASMMWTANCLAYGWPEGKLYEFVPLLVLHLLLVGNFKATQHFPSS